MMEPLHLLSASSSPSFGGLERFQMEIARNLALRGHAVEIAAAPGSPFAAAGKVAGLPVHERRFHSYLSPLSAWRLARLMKSREIDVVHYRLSKNIWAMAPAARLAGLKGRVVHTLGMNPGGQLDNPVHRWLRNTLGAFVAPTPETATKAATVWGMEEDEVTVIPNFVTPAPFESVDLDRDAAALRASWGVPVESRLVGTLARLEPAKGIDTFVRAAIAVLQTASQQTAPQPDLRFIAGGPVKKEWESWLDDLKEPVASAGFTDRIIFPGHQDNVPAFMKSLDFFVLPSRKETFGIVLLEAMISGRAVLACGGPGPDYILDGGDAGLLVEPDDHDGMSQAMLTLLGNDEHRDRLALAGQARVRANFTDEVVLPAYEALFDRVRATNTISRKP